MDEVFALYRGPFLPDESEQPAYIAYREQLRARLLRCLVRVARVWEDTGRGDAAVDGYLRCVEADPLFEAPYRNLMLCYQRAGDTAEARATYERLRAISSTRMKTLPSQETQAVFCRARCAGRALARLYGNAGSFQLGLELAPDLVQAMRTAEGGGYSRRGMPEGGGAISRMRMVSETSVPAGTSIVVELITISSPSGSNLTKYAMRPTCFFASSRSFGRSRSAACRHSSGLSGIGAGAKTLR